MLDYENCYRAGVVEVLVCSVAFARVRFLAATAASHVSRGSSPSLVRVSRSSCVVDQCVPFSIGVDDVLEGGARRRSLSTNPETMRPY